MVAISDLVSFLFTQSIGTTDPDSNIIIQKQEDFAARHGITRETLIGWMNGRQSPELFRIKELILKEGYKLDDCIEAPARARAEVHGKYPQLFQDLEAFLLNEVDDTIIVGIGNLLRQSARAATAKKRKLKQKAVKESRGKLTRHVKKKQAG